MPEYLISLEVFKQHFAGLLPVQRADLIGAGLDLLPIGAQVGNYHRIGGKGLCWECRTPEQRRRRDRTTYVTEHRHTTSSRGMAFGPAFENAGSTSSKDNPLIVAAAYEALRREAEQEPPAPPPPASPSETAAPTRPPRTGGVAVVFACNKVRQCRSIMIMTKPITIAETTVFRRFVESEWTEAEYTAFIRFIAYQPDAGDLVPGTGGLRKVRWSKPGAGKRGGVRVIYFYHDPEMPLFLLIGYAKGDQADLSSAQRKRLSEIMQAIKEHYGRK
jgi:hypothetical protein